MSHPEDVRKAVREHYRQIALDAEGSNSSCCEDGDCACDNSALYQVDVSGLPEAVTGLSLGCGDPITLANLKPGQTVLDLGSGGGIDCFLAAERVGAEGFVIGVDMTAEMIQKAERNKFATGHKNVEFRLGQIEALPVDSDSVDVIISNCVINLSPDKEAVFREAFRVLRPGGLLAVSDMVTQGRFTADQRSDLDSWAECVAGAEDLSVYVALLRQAGFTAITLSDSGNLALDLLQSAGLYIGPPRLFSARVTAIKPASAAGQRQ